MHGYNTACSPVLISKEAGITAILFLRIEGSTILPLTIDTPSPSTPSLPTGVLHRQMN